MLERYEGKLSRAVLRREEASNRLFLVYDKNVPEFAVKIPSRSRMTRMNEFHECLCVNLCHHKIGDVSIRITVEGGI